MGVITTTTARTIPQYIRRIPSRIVPIWLGADGERDVFGAGATATLLAAIVAGLFVLRRHSSSRRGLQQQKQAKRPPPLGMPILRNTPQGNALPFIGHGLTFLRYPPWDLITAWHNNSSSNLSGDKNTGIGVGDGTENGPHNHRSGSYSPIVCFPLLGATYFSVASPSLCRAILQSKISHIHKDIVKTMKPFLSILGTGIVSSEGEAWLRQRLKMSHPLRRDVLDLIPAQTLAAVQRLMAVLDAAAATRRKVPLGSLLRHLTLQVISGSFLSLGPEESDSTFAVLYLPIVDESNQRVWHPYRRFCFFMPSFWRYQSNVCRLNAYVSSLIRKRWDLRRKERTAQLSSVRQVDILDKVLAVFEKEFPNATVLPESAVRQFRDEMKTFMLAGHETSAAMMTWALYELMHSDDLMNDVESEAATVFDVNLDWRNASLDKDIPNPEELAKLNLSEASLKVGNVLCVRISVPAIMLCLRRLLYCSTYLDSYDMLAKRTQESLRKYSVVPIAARRVVEDLYLEEGPYFLPKGSSVMINILGVHLDPKLWPEPMRYNPRRFLTDRSIEPFTFLPFIAGPRNCLGQHLALLESKMVISMLVQRYKLDLPCKMDTEDWSNGKDPRHRFMVPVIPKEELMVSVKLKF
jgi:cytochrome P450